MTIRSYLRASIIGAAVFLVAGCGQDETPIDVYAGKGLRLAVEEAKVAFEQKEGISVSVIYAGSNTLLSTIQTTGRGDVYIPGSESYIKKAGELIQSHVFVAHHVPIFAVNPNKKSQIRSFADLIKPGVRIAVGNKQMAAIGRVTEAILKSAGPDETFRENITTTSSTVNELLHMVVNGSVDASLIWSDMLLWDGAGGLIPVSIPDHLKEIKDIRAGVLTTSKNPIRAEKFVQFMANEGRAIFIKHGFVKDSHAD